MKKKILMDTLLEMLESNRQMLASSALEARAAATGDEVKPENKYDTRGLEASYLAGAQAKRSHDLEVAIQHLKRFKLRAFTEETPIDLTAVIEVQSSASEIKNFFLLPYAGGTKVDHQNKIYNVITPESPLGRMLIGKKVGDSFDMKIKGVISENEILSVY
jgi:hypothetical protein